MIKYVPLVLTALAVIALSGSAVAGDVSAGQTKYTASCASCHGANGQGMGNFPPVKRHSPEHTAKVLALYKEGNQDALKEMGLGNQFSLMAPNASALSDEDMQNLGAFIATL